MQTHEHENTQKSPGEVNKPKGKAAPIVIVAVRVSASRYRSHGNCALFCDPMWPMWQSMNSNEYRLVSQMP